MLSVLVQERDEAVEAVEVRSSPLSGAFVVFTLQIADQDGLDAQFVVACPVLALDLALRAGRAGISWRVVAGSPGRALSLWELRESARAAAAAEPAQAEHLGEVLRAERHAAAASLN